MSRKEFYGSMRRGAWIFLISGLFLIITVLGWLWKSEENYRKELLAEGDRLLLSEKKLFLEQLSDLFADTRVFAEMASSSLHNGQFNREQISRLQSYFLALAGWKQLYHQVRLLGAEGMERIRIESSPHGERVVPDKELQDKSDRDYFVQVMKTPAEAYLSKFDPNIEHGEIEYPLNPTLRFSATVLDSDKARRGVVVINWKGTLLLEEMKKLARGTSGQIFLLNDEGYWLLGPKPEDEWASVGTPDRSKTMAVQDRDAWRLISSSLQGHFFSSSGLYVWKTIDPSGDLQQSPVRVTDIRAAESWKLLYVVPPDKLIPTWKNRTLAILAGLLTAAAIISCVAGHDHYRKQVLWKSLAESEQRFRVVTNTVRDSIVMIDSSGTIMFWSPAAERMFGYGEKEAVGKDLHALVASAANRLKAREGLAQFGQSGSGYVVHQTREVEALRKDGSSFHAEISVASLLEENEWFAVGTVRDISERKIAESILRESEERYRAVFESASVGIDLVDVGGRFLQVNDAWFNMLGYSRDELLDKTICDVTHPDDVQESREVRDRIVAGEMSTYRFRKRYIRKDGRVVWVDESQAALREQGTGRLTLVRVVLDITEWLEAEAARDRVVSGIEQAAEMFIITDAEGTIQYVNPAFERVTGYTGEEVLGRNSRLLASVQQDALFREQLWDTIRAGNVWSGRLIDRKKDGSLYHAEATVSPVVDGAGNIANFVAVIRDITEQVALSKQLVQAQKMEAVGTLAGGVAHDFNNLLQVVLGYSELALSDEGLSKQLAEDLTKVNRAARSGAELVKRLLTFSRKTEMEQRPLQLNQTIEQMKKMLSRTIPKMIEIRLVLADDLATIHADPTQMEQVLMNLAVNARDAMPGGGICTIRTENVILEEAFAATHFGVQPGNYVMLSVSDTGKGMDQETQLHIFEPFFTTKGPGEGTGLGLAMVYGIVQHHNGHIRCRSEVGEGTTFEMYLPSMTTEVGNGKPELLQRRPPTGSETILLVDDDNDVRDLGSRLLTKAGYKVIEARRGGEALEVYRNRPGEISLVVLDLIMPEMGGVQCLEELLKIDPSARVVIASGQADGGGTLRATKDLARGFVSKPFQFDRLLWAVREALDQE